MSLDPARHANQNAFVQSWNGRSAVSCLATLFVAVTHTRAGARGPEA